MSFNVDTDDDIESFFQDMKKQSTIHTPTLQQTLQYFSFSKPQKKIDQEDRIIVENGPISTISNNPSININELIDQIVKNDEKTIIGAIIKFEGWIKNYSDRNIIEYYPMIAKTLLSLLVNGTEQLREISSRIILRYVFSHLN